jgi:hypothetical protein
MLDNPYESISSDLMTNFLPVQPIDQATLTLEEKTKLEEERKANVEKLQEYKNRLEQRQLK